MFEDKTQAFLNDILEAAKRITLYTDNIPYEAFLSDIKTQDAVVRNLEIIGEATKQIPDEIRQHAPHIPWKSITGMRDKLIHQYFGVNLDIVWNVVQDDLPKLVEAIESILSAINMENSTTDTDRGSE